MEKKKEPSNPNVIVKLPSGSKLEIMPAPFAESKALYQAMLSEGLKIKVNGFDSVENAIKDIFCLGLSSPVVEACLHRCMQRATYNGLKITEETFEPVEARQDYLPACSAVMKENIQPFTKSLYAQYKEALEQVRKLSSVPA